MAAGLHWSRPAGTILERVLNRKSGLTRILVVVLVLELQLQALPQPQANTRAEGDLIAMLLLLDDVARCVGLQLPIADLRMNVEAVRLIEQQVTGKQAWNRVVDRLASCDRGIAMFDRRTAHVRVAELEEPMLEE